MASVKVTVPCGIFVPALVGVTVAFSVTFWLTAGLFVGETLRPVTEVPLNPIDSEKLCVVAVKLTSPLYAAVTVWVPAVGSEKEHEASPLGCTTAVQVAEVVVSVKTTLPVGTDAPAAPVLAGATAESCTLYVAD